MTIPAYMQFSNLSIQDALALYGDQLPSGWSNKLEEICAWMQQENEDIERLEGSVEDLESDVEDLTNLRDETEAYLDGITQNDDPMTIKHELVEILNMYGYTLTRGRC